MVLFLPEVLVRSFDVFQEFSVYKEHDVNCDISCFHEGHGELEERLCQLE